VFHEDIGHNLQDTARITPLKVSGDIYSFKKNAHISIRSDAGGVH